MKRLFRLAVFTFALLAANQAWAVREFSGVAPSGATYSIAAPDDWQPGDTLVLYQHGFNFGAPAGTPSLGPLRDVMLGEGYAVAATSYRQRGWALFHAMDDNRDLLAIFENLVGTPGEILPFGGSMGGLTALKLAEEPGFPPVHGVYALCPAAAGARVWDQAIDLRLAYPVVCEGTGSLPTGDEPLPWAVNLDDIPDDLGNLLDDGPVLDALISLNRCTGVDLPPALRNDAMRRRLAELEAFGHFTSEDFFVTNMGYATFALGDLVRAPDKLDATNPFTTAGVHYEDASIDAGIERITADPLAAFEFHWLSDFRGDVGNAKVLSLQTSRDELVIPANQSVLRSELPADQITSAIVAEDEPTHCGFTDAEGLAGWEALRQWKDGAPQPTVASLQRDCEALVAAGTGGPCRLDADVQDVPSFDSQVPARPANPAPPIDARYSGEWFDPDRNGEGIVLEILDGGFADVYFFTYPPATEPGQQAWMTGVGTIDGNSIAFEDVRRPQAIATPNGTRVEKTPWGRIWLTFDDCSHGEMRWEGPDGWGNMTVPITRLTALAGLDCSGGTADAPPQSSGLWFDPAHDGSGFAVEQLDADTQVAFYFEPGTTPDSQSWSLGLVPTMPYTLPGPVMYDSYGPRFGADYDATAFHSEARFNVDRFDIGCGNSGSAVLSPAFGPGVPPPPLVISLTRLTRPSGTPPCVP
ncbi:MAG: hypothetical protein WBV61_13300 [Rhodanobacteraceae bacterium]